MNQKLREPNIVKGIPPILIRPLPSIYYYNEYSTEKNPLAASSHFFSNVTFLSEAIQLLGQEVGENGFSKLSKEVAGLSELVKPVLGESIREITQKLSSLCLQYKMQVNESVRKLSEQFVEIYHKIVKRISILLVNNNQEPQRVTKLAGTLSNTCHYIVELCDTSKENFALRIFAADFIVFASAFPSRVHADVEKVDTYRKPNLILAAGELDRKIDMQALRNGAMLARKGHKVLYKLFSPIRLYTEIDKIYMKYMLTEML